MRIKTLADGIDSSYLNPVLKDEKGNLRPVLSSILEEIPEDHILHWCVRNGVYQIPTVELIDWIRGKIGERSAIEICAGNGAIGRALGIKATDSYMQTLPQVALLYKTLGQATTTLAPEVEKLEALEAVKKYKPQVVVGSYCTQVGSPGDTEASSFGVDEEAILTYVETYIHVGNQVTHGKKRILKRPHETFQFPWLFGRSFDKKENCIYVWNTK